MNESQYPAPMQTQSDAQLLEVCVAKVGVRKHRTIDVVCQLQTEQDEAL
jgi:hypothetical protein